MPRQYMNRGHSEALCFHSHLLVCFLITSVLQQSSCGKHVASWTQPETILRTGWSALSNDTQQQEKSSQAQSWWVIAFGQLVF